MVSNASNFARNPLKVIHILEEEHMKNAKYIWSAVKGNWWIRFWELEYLWIPSTICNIFNHFEYLDFVSSYKEILKNSLPNQKKKEKEIQYLIRFLEMGQHPLIYWKYITLYRSVDLPLASYLNIILYDFWLLKKLKIAIEREMISNCGHKENMMRHLITIPKEGFTDCFEKWKECWDKYATLQNKYFERDYDALALGKLYFC